MVVKIFVVEPIAEEHVGRDGLTHLDVRDSEAFREDDAVAADDGNRCARCLPLLQRREHGLFELT
jgi:hypothetical protein